MPLCLRGQKGTNLGLRQLNLCTHAEPRGPNHLVEGQAEALQFRKRSTNISAHRGSRQSLRGRWSPVPGNTLKRGGGG